MGCTWFPSVGEQAVRQVQCLKAKCFADNQLKCMYVIIKKERQKFILTRSKKYCYTGIYPNRLNSRVEIINQRLK